MEQCAVSINMQYFDNVSIQLIIVSLAISGVVRYWKHAFFCAALLFFYMLALIFHCHIKAADPSGVYRYLIWSLNDIVFLFVLYALVKNKLAEMRALLISSFLEIIAITAHIVRLFDMKLTGGAVSDPFYPTLINITNLGYVLLAVIPTTCALIKRK